MKLKPLFLLGILTFLAHTLVPFSSARADDEEDEDIKALSSGGLTQQIQNMNQKLQKAQGSSKDGKISEEQLKSLQTEINKGKAVKAGQPVTAESNEELEERLRGVLSKTPVGPFFNGHPKILSFVTQVMRDPEVMAGLLDTISNSGKMTNYRYTALALIFFGFIINLIGKKNQGLVSRLAKKLFVFTFFLSAQFANFAFFFPRPARAIFGIFKNVFLK